jgi:small-conductance mechanosensitive channel
VSRTAPDPGAKVGVWRALGSLGDLSIKELLWPEGLPALVVGGGGAALALRTCGLSTRIGAVEDLLALAGPLLAVVFAALALVVSIPSSNYMRALSESGRGIKAFLDPFLLTAGTQALIILLAFGYLLVAASVSRTVEHIAFYVIGAVFVYGLLDIIALARSLVRHGIYRTTLARIEAEGDDASGRVRPLRRDSQGQ